MTRPRLELHIEELVLHGFSPDDRDALASTLQHELARRLEGGVPPALVERGAFERIDAGAFRVVAPVRPAAVGAQVAGAITGALGAGDS